MPARKSSPKKVRAPSPVRKVEGFVNAVDLEPTREVFMAMHWTGLLMLMFAIAAATAWVYYVVQAVNNNAVGGADGRGASETDVTTADATADTAAGETRQVDTIKVMFEGLVVSSLLYFVVRHHYRSHY